MLDVFSEIKHRLPTQEVLVYYGYRPNRAGYICCPFHSDRTPSLKIYPDGWKCYGCDKGGSVIDFVAEVFDLTPLEAAKQLNRDFSLYLPLGDKPAEVDWQAIQYRQVIAEAHGAFEEWRESFIDILNIAIRRANTVHIETLNELTESETSALQLREAFEYWADELSHGTPEAQAQIYRERGQIAQWIQQVLKS